jgi:hypothetical protein
VNSPAWLQQLAAVYRWLRPDAETRRRTRYYIFDLIGWVAGTESDALAAKQQEEPKMKVPFKQTVVAALLAILILASPALAADPKSANKKSPPPVVQQGVQQQLAEQQQRILELERLLKEQGLLLETLRQHLVAQEQKAALSPNSASAQEPATQGATPNQELERISGELDAVAQANKELGEKVNSVEKKTSDNEKNITAKTRGLGNFTFSGDVRVRYEPFFGGTQSEDRHPSASACANANAKFSDRSAAG